MISSSFCIPIYFIPDLKTTLREKLISKIDDYFHIQGPVFKVTNRLSSNNSWKYEGSIVPQKEALAYSNKLTVLLIILKIISYITVIIPLVMLLTKFLLRYPYPLTVITDQDTQTLPRIISDTTISLKPTPILPFTQIKKEFISQEELKYIHSLLKQVFPKAIQKKSHPLITRYHLSANKNIVFELKDFPHLIFKTYNDESSIQTRFETMQLIEKFIKEKNYDKLVIPQSDILKFLPYKNRKTHYCIIEEKIDIPEEHTKNELGWPIPPGEHGWLEEDEKLRPAIIQLAHVIQKTGLSDIYHRNVPAIIDNNTWKIALIDTDNIENSPGMVYYNLSQLIFCSSSIESIDAIINASTIPLNLDPRSQASFFKDLQRRKKEQLETLLIQKAKKLLYQKMQLALYNINNPYKPIKVNIEALGLDLTQTALNPSLEEVSIITIIKKVIHVLNTQLEKNSYSQKHTHAQHREIFFNTHIYDNNKKDYIEHSNKLWSISHKKCPPLLNLLGLNQIEENKFKALLSLPKMYDSNCLIHYQKALEYQQKTWLCQIITALQEKGYIFSSDYMLKGEKKIVFNGDFLVCL